MRPVLQKNQERRILTGMVLDDGFLGRVASIYRDDLFDTPYLKRLARLCVEYYKEHHQAPRKNMEGLFLRESKKLHDDEDIELMSALLSELSQDADEESNLNAQYMAEEAEEHFNAVRLKLLCDDIEGHLSNGEVRQATNRILGYNKIDLSSSGGIFVFDNRDAWHEAFQAAQEPLFHLPGAVGTFTNRYWVRDSFVAFQGGEKSGKSFYLAEIAFRALRNRRRVAVIEAGDQSQSQYLLRVASRLSGLPLWASDAGPHDCPLTVRKQEGGGRGSDSFDVTSERRNISECLTEGTAHHAIKSFMRRCRIQPKNFAFAAHPNNSCSLSDISGQLDVWEVQDGFIPDVLLVDYADILRPENDRDQTRDQINKIWMGLRRLSQERHILVVTGTQAKRGSHQLDEQDSESISEDKRKFAHVTALLGLTQIKRKKAKDDEEETACVGNLTRLNWIGGRWGVEGGHHTCVVLGDYPCGKVIIDSCFE